MKRLSITLLFGWCLILSVFSQECIDYTDLYAPNVKATYGTTSDPYKNVGVASGRHTIIESRHVDPISVASSLLYTTPAPNVPSVRLGNANIGAEAESITYGFDVPIEGTLLLLQYAVVLQDPNHTESEQPRFIMRITDDQGNSLDAVCLDADFITGKNTSDWIKGEGRYENVRYKNWSTLGINLLPYSGTHINITFTTYDCEKRGHFGYAYFTLSCQSGEIDVVSCGSENTVDLVAPDGFNYKWYKTPDDVNVISTERVLQVPFDDASTYVCYAISKEMPSCFFPLSATAEKRDPIANGHIYSCGKTIVCSEMSTIHATSPDGIVTDMHKSCEDFLWDFGDGAISRDANPVHTYAQDGVYTVTLHAGIHNNRCVDTWTQKVTVKTQYTETLAICEQELPYHWRDTTFQEDTKSDVFTFQRKNESNCDSIVTLHLTVYPKYNQQEAETICENALPYTWRDTTFQVNTESDIYTFHRSSIYGCDSIVTLNLTVHPSYEQTFSLELCEDELPTIWNGNILERDYTTGTYTFFKKTIHGCDSIVHLNLTVHPLHHETVNIEICPSEFPTVLCDSIFDIGTVSNQYVFNRTSIHGCDSIITLNLKVLPTFDYNAPPITLCQNELPYHWRDTIFEAGTTSRTYHFKRQTVNGCDSIVHLALTVHPSYEQTFSLELCEDDLPYIWNGNLLERDYTTDTYTFFKKTIHGCDSIIHLDLTVHSCYSEKVDMTMCPHEFPAVLCDSIFDVGTVSNQYMFHRSSIHGCDSIVTLNLTVLPAFDYTVPISICENDLPYTWRDTTFEKGTKSSKYTFRKQTINGCDSIVHLDLIVHPAYEHPFSLDICKDELPYRWYDNVLDRNYKTGTYTFNKTTINGCDSIIILDLRVHDSYHQKERLTICPQDLPLAWRDTIFDIGTAQGQHEYVFHRSSIHGCDSIVTLNLTVLPAFDYTVPISVCENDLPYTWRDTTFEKGTKSSRYTFRKQTINGCDSIVHLDLTIHPSYIENAIREICQNDLPYNWKGHIFDKDTRTNTFNYSYTTVNGCDSIQNLHLIVHENVMITENIAICSSELPYHWRDTTFGVGTKTNTFVFKKQTVHNSDSIVTLHLMVHPSYRDTVELMLCQNELPYIWRDTVFGRGTMSGYYHLHDYSIHGCDSITVVHLQVHPTYAETEELILCHSDLPYKWRTKIIDNSMTDGTYTFHEKTIHGCDSIVNLRLEIRPPQNTEEASTVCRSSLPMEWRDTIFTHNTRSGIYSVYREDQYGCINKHTLTLTVKDTSIVHFYDSIYVDSVYTNHNFYFVAPHGLDEIMLEQHHTNQVMCDSSVFLHLEILEPPFVALLDIPNVCADQSICDFAISYSNLRFYPDKITVTFDEYAKQAGFVDYVSTKIKGYTMISVPKNVIPDIYHGTITFTTDHFTQKTDFELMIQYPSSIIEQHWNDVLALRDETLNGGFYFEEFQWYRNGAPIIEETSSFLYVGPNEQLDMTAEYQVLIRRVGEEKKIFTCPLIPVYHPDIQEYPTIVGRSQVLKMPIASNTSFTLYSVLGELVMQRNLTPDDNEIVVPNRDGIYIVHVIDANMHSFTYKMIIK